MFAWIAPIIAKVPRKMLFIAGGVFVAVCFFWTFWTLARTDGVKDERARGAVAIERARAQAAEKYAKDTADLARAAQAADASVGRTETIVIKESADAAREIQAAPGADVVVDIAAWRAARDAIGRLRKPSKDLGSDPAPDAGDSGTP